MQQVYRAQLFRRAPESVGSQTRVGREAGSTAANVDIEAQRVFVYISTTACTA